VVTLLVLENQAHHQRDDRVTAGLGDVLVLTERVGLQCGVSLDRVEQADERFTAGVALTEDIRAYPSNHVIHGNNPSNSRSRIPHLLEA